MSSRLLDLVRRTPASRSVTVLAVAVATLVVCAPAIGRACQDLDPTTSDQTLIGRFSKGGERPPQKAALVVEAPEQCVWPVVVIEVDASEQPPCRPVVQPDLPDGSGPRGPPSRRS